MNPFSTMLLLLGYSLVIPLSFRLPSFIKKQRRIALAGYQLGLLLVIVGWFTRSKIFLACVHILVLILIKAITLLATKLAERNASPE